MLANNFSLTAVAPAPVRDLQSGRNEEIDAYSIEEFCRRHGISRSTYYNLKATETGPKEKRAMGRILITKEAAHEWRERT